MPRPASLTVLCLAIVLAPSIGGASPDDAPDRVRVRLPFALKLVSVQPGVQLVANAPEQVFLARGAYWVRRDGRWYRAEEHWQRFVRVDARVVPRAVANVAAQPAPGAAPAPKGAPAPPAAVAPPPAYQEIVRAKEIDADRVVARVIYAREVKARNGHVLRVVRDEDGKAWARERGGAKLRAEEVEADVVYAKDIHARWIQAAEIHAKDVKIGP